MAHTLKLCVLLTICVTHSVLPALGGTTPVDNAHEIIAGTGNHVKFC